PAECRCTPWTVDQPSSVLIPHNSEEDTVMKNVRAPFAVVVGAVCLFGIVWNASGAPPTLEDQLRAALRAAGFTGTIQSTLVPRLGRPINNNLADLGRLLWFDKSGGLHSDNTCGGCHSPSTGFGDTQSIAIGIQNNNVVGPNRTGPRN